MNEDKIKNLEEEIASMKTRTSIYKKINSDYTRFMNWACLRDPPYWGKLLQDWKNYVKKPKHPNDDTLWEQLDLFMTNKQ